MRRLLLLALHAVALAVAAVPFLVLIGLGIHRQAAPWAVSGAAMLLVFAPPFFAAAAAPARRRPLVLPSTAIAWALALFFVLPVYFPGERSGAAATGLATLGLGSDLFGLPARLAATLPEEPAMATPEVAEAEVVAVPALPPPPPLGDDQIALPYEGEGRRMSVPVIFGNDGVELEVDMMFDTGATYTTLSHAFLAKLGVHPSDADPVIQLHTANGEREARIVLLDHVWLGDLRLDGLAIATCDDCASSDTAGLLGLNVAGGFNLSIDADRREVVFQRRARFDRKLDIKPFVDLSATFTRFPGGRVEVHVKLENRSDRAISAAKTAVRCDGGEWSVALGPLEAGAREAQRRKLPPHDPCETYDILLSEAFW